MFKPDLHSVPVTEGDPVPNRKPSLPADVARPWRSDRGGPKRTRCLPPPESRSVPKGPEDTTQPRLLSVPRFNLDEMTCRVEDLGVKGDVLPLTVGEDGRTVAATGTGTNYGRRRSVPTTFGLRTTHPVLSGRGV